MGWQLNCLSFEWRNYLSVKVFSHPGYLKVVQFCMRTTGPVIVIQEASLVPVFSCHPRISFLDEILLEQDIKSSCSFPIFF